MDSDRKTSNLTKEVIEQCDKLADELLFSVKKKRQLSEYGCMEYTEEISGDTLLICQDGSLLFGPKEIGRHLSLKAFKNGLRSDREALVQRRESRELLDSVKISE